MAHTTPLSYLQSELFFDEYMHYMFIIIKYANPIFIIDSNDMGRSKMAEKKKNNQVYIYSGILAIALITIISIFIFGGETPTTGKVTTPLPAPIEPTTIVPPAITPPEAILAQAKESFNCSEGAAIGFVRRNRLANGDVEATIFNPKKPKLEGLRYRFYNVGGNIIGGDRDILVGNATQIKDVVSGDEFSFRIPFSDNPEAIKAEIIPISTINGQRTLCINQRLVLILQ